MLGGGQKNDQTLRFLHKKGKILFFYVDLIRGYNFGKFHQLKNGQFE